MTRSGLLFALVLTSGLLIPSSARGAPGDENWSPLFDLPGLNGAAYALLQTPDGAVVAGGDFTTAGGAQAGHIAAWYGASWMSLGSGMDAPVRALAIYNGVLVAAGDFLTAGGVTSNYVAAWDGASWRPLGTGISDRVQSLCVWQGILFAGGVSGVFRLDSGTWSRLSSGPTSWVYALCVYQHQLYAAGIFQYLPGSIAANYIARYDGTSWSAVGSGLAANGFALVVHNGELYAGGGPLQKWTGTQWVTVGSGPYMPIYSLLSANGVLYVGGRRYTGYQPSGGVAQWNGFSWSPLGTGVTGPCVECTLPLSEVVYALASVGSGVAVGGYFSQAGDVNANNAALWNGTSWQPMTAPLTGAGVDCDVRAIASYGGRFVAAGSFMHAGVSAATRIACWNGVGWIPLGGGLDGTVLSLREFGGDLIAGGQFTHAGGVTANHVARWDGSFWHAMGIGTDITSDVWSMIIWRGDLYAATFSQGIARWTGSGWTFLPGAPVTNLHCLDIYRDQLVTTGESGGQVAAWDGDSWHLLGTGVGESGGFGSWIFAMKAVNDRLYVGGDFNLPGLNIAQWDGSSWSAVGSGLNAQPGALGAYGSSLVAGGRFGTAGGISATHIARWDGSSWSAFGSGLPTTGDTPGPRAFLEDYGLLIVGGRFRTAGMNPSWNIAAWGDATRSSVAAPVHPRVPPLAVEVAPNPMRGCVSIAYSQEKPAPVTVRIHDSAGRLVAILLDGALPAGRNVFTWTGRDAGGRESPPGVYFLRIDAAGATRTVKVVLAR